MPGESFLRPFFTAIFKLLFRVEVRGREHIEAAGDRVLVIANHLSYLEPILIGTFMPETPSYAINIYQADKFNWLEKFFNLYRLDPSKPLSMKRLIQDLRSNSKSGRKRVVIFPEGRISTSGGIMKIYDGTGMIIEKTGATVLPVRIDGTEFSKVSRLGTRLRQRWFPKVTITFLPPVRFEIGQKVPSHTIYDIMTKAAFAATPTRHPILAGVLDAYQLHGGKHAIACDTARVDMNYRQLFTRAFILSKKLTLLLSSSSAASHAVGDLVQSNQIHASARPREDNAGKYIGVMLPNANAAMVTFLALHMLEKIPCMLNFSAGKASVLHACRIANVKTVLTSRVFIEKGKLEALIEGLQSECTIIYLEDIRPSVTIIDKLSGLYRALFPRQALQGVLSRTNSDEPAIILYTSGSEGVPKGVALSHANILSNIAQFSARIDLTTSDIVFNAMPIFHSFGMTAGLVMPMLRGIKVFLYPTPLHYRIIPDLLYDSDATIMIATDTFYNGYAHYAHPYDFWKIRLAVAGAEKLRDATRKLYTDKYRVNILEGYGVTEAGPVVSVNTPMENKVGTVGRALPDIECRVQPVSGMDTGGRLLLKGPNMMLGYLKADQPCVIQPFGEWYDTGDIVDIDDEGFIRIIGRAKRFAKIAGEMVSLMIAEDLALEIMPDVAHATIAIPDERKGEQSVLFTESNQLTKEHLIQHAKIRGVAEICLPKHIEFLEAIPRLGNGKIDYVSLSGKWRSA